MNAVHLGPLIVLMAITATLLALSGAGWFERMAPPGDRRDRVRAPTSARLGRVVRRMLHRPPDAAADRRAGIAVLLAVGGSLVDPVVAVFGAMAPYGWRVVRARQIRTRASDSFVRELPDVVDLFRVAANAGLTVHDAVREVSRVVAGPVETSLNEAQRRVGLGHRLSDVLPLLVEVGEPIRPLVRVLVSAERDGAPLAEPLERVSAHARDVRRRCAEEAARRVPVRLLLPLVACVLPAFVLLTVVPLLAGTLQTLRP